MRGQQLTLLQFLEKGSGKKLKLKINDNRSTLLSVRWGPECTKVSMHRIFLQAPESVMIDLAHYLKGEGKGKTSPQVKAFIQNSFRKVDYAHELDVSSLIQKGAIYDLQEIYDALNREYFEDKLNLSITWFGSPSQRRRSKITFGLYYDPLKLIKIHRLLDKALFPKHLVSFVVYHEMLHHVCPPYVDEKGIHRIHTKEFREEEGKFKQFKESSDWIHQYRHQLFM